MTHFYINSSTPPQLICQGGGPTEVHNAGPVAAEFAPSDGSSPVEIPPRSRVVVEGVGYLRGSNAHITLTSPGGR